MKEIVKVLLQEGIDEETIHEVLSVIEENYEITDEGFLDKAKEFGNKVADKVTDAVTKSDNPIVDKIRKTKLVKNTIGKRALNKRASDLDHTNTKASQMLQQANENPRRFMKDQGRDFLYPEGSKNLKADAIERAKNFGGAAVHSKRYELDDAAKRYGFVKDDRGKSIKPRGTIWGQKM